MFSLIQLLIIGKQRGIFFPNSITSSYTFDDNGNLNDLHYRKGNGSTVQRFQYTYDKNGMRTGMTDNDGTHDYAYDALYQITRATHPTVQNPVTELVEVEQFQYDEVGNWLNDNRIHNDLNQLIEDDSCFYQYDADGNMTGKISKSSGDTTSLTWDIENKLVEVRKPGLLVQYEYDATGRRVTKNVNGIETQFRYDGDDLILEMNDSDSVVANYTFGPGIDDPIAMHRDNQNYYYLKDGLGSVRALTDSIGNTVKEYRYSVFGKITEESGDSDLWNPFTYTSRELEKELGIYFYRARYFDPEMGRFLSEDPISADLNFYRYVFNNPLRFIDPLGLQEINPYSEKHTYRNRNNKCPKKPPEKCDRNSNGNCGQKKEKGKYYDHEGNEWAPDNPWSSAYFHGGHFGWKTFRGLGMFKGSQCTYSTDGSLVDSGKYMGTYDYGEPGTFEHWKNDVEPHNVNPNYVPYLTTQY